MKKRKSTKKIDPKYYDETDFTEDMRNASMRIVHKGVIKRVTMNISKQSYDDAVSLDAYMNLGYQNVLKVAMALGLNDLRKALLEKKDIGKLLKA
jgi:hypothetical protein